MRPRELCTVVLSYNNEDTVIGAVDSLLAQRPEVEVVVSHSGGGPTPRSLASLRPSVRVVAAEERRLPGAARNAGLAATSAPYVSYLAADCRALPGWAEGRLRRHRDGVEAVASALVAADSGLISLAAHLLQNSFRMPHVETPPMLRSGVSYTREVLERHGPFPETFPFGEDIALNDRLLAAGIEIALAPEVVTAHLYETSLRGMLVECFHRGGQRGSVYRTALRRASLGVVGSLMSAALALVRAGHRGSEVSHGQLLGLTPLLAAGSLATAVGNLVGPYASPPTCPELVSLRRRTWAQRALKDAPTRELPSASSAAASRAKLQAGVQRGRQQVVRAIDQTRLGDVRFCLVSDDCWGSDVYRHLDRPYNTPFVGLFVKSEHYLRLLGDLRSYLAEPLHFRAEPGESRGVSYPVGVLEDVEIHFLHYQTRQEARGAWKRRVARIDFDHLAVKFRASGQAASGNQVDRFENLPFEKKVVFSASAMPGVVHVPNWTWDEAFSETQKVFDVVTWLKGGQAAGGGSPRMLEADDDQALYAPARSRPRRLLGSQMSLMRDAGIISPEGLSSVTKGRRTVRAAKYDRVTDTNRHLRKSLSERPQGP